MIKDDYRWLWLQIMMITDNDAYRQRWPWRPQCQKKIAMFTCDFKEEENIKVKKTIYLQPKKIL